MYTYKALHVEIIFRCINAFLEISRNNQKRNKQKSNNPEIVNNKKIMMYNLSMYHCS